MSGSNYGLNYNNQHRKVQTTDLVYYLKKIINVMFEFILKQLKQFLVPAV